MDKRLHKLLFYTFLLSVYGLFFSVESFYNFEGQLNVTAIFQSALSQSPANSLSVVKASSSPSSSRHRVRLNKRYHQEEVYPCPIFQVDAPAAYIIPKVLGFYRPCVLPAVTRTNLLLRGPPVIA